VNTQFSSGTCIEGILRDPTKKKIKSEEIQMPRCAVVDWLELERGREVEIPRRLGYTKKSSQKRRERENLFQLIFIGLIAGGKKNVYSAMKGLC